MTRKIQPDLLLLHIAHIKMTTPLTITTGPRVLVRKSAHAKIGKAKVIRRKRPAISDDAIRAMPMAKYLENSPTELNVPKGRAESLNAENFSPNLQRSHC